jgi:hypothetical protein
LTIGIGHFRKELTEAEQLPLGEVQVLNHFKVPGALLTLVDVRRNRCRHTDVQGRGRQAGQKRPDRATSHVSTCVGEVQPQVGNSRRRTRSATFSRLVFGLGKDGLEPIHFGPANPATAYVRNYLRTN